jgi:Kef-type K+ transport system membrane component KefB
MRPPRAVIALAALLAFGAGDALAAGSAAAGQTFLWLAVILFLARLSSLVEKAGIPGVLGELLMGVALGNLGLLGIGLFDRIADDATIAVFAELGVVILLFQIGLETTVADLARVGWRALAVAVIGVIVPFLAGTFVVGPLLLPGLPFKAYLFLGATLCATSVGITGRVFRDAQRLDSPESRIVLGAAVIDDVLGLVILAVVTGFVQSGTVSAGDVARIVLEAFGFLVGAVVIGRAAAPHLVRMLRGVSDTVATKLTLLLSVGLGLAWLAHAIGLAPIIGAFAAGVLLEPIFLKDFEAPEIVRELEPLVDTLPAADAGRARRALDRYRDHHHAHLLEPLGHFLVPVFFVFTGMQVKLQALADPTVVAVALGITVVAIAGKVVAGVAAGPVNRWVVGWGMVPRGEVGLIFAAIGKQLGVVDDRLFSVIVAMVILTTLATPPILAWLLARQGAGAPPANPVS